METETTEVNDTEVVAETENTEVVEAPETEAPKVEPVSQKVLALTRRENALWRREKELKAKEAKYTENETSFSSKQELYKTDPDAMLKDHGYTYETLIDRVLNGDQNPQNAIESRTAVLEKELATERQLRLDREADQEKTQKDTQAKQFLDTLTTNIDDAGTHELIIKTKSHKLVLQTIIANPNVIGFIENPLAFFG